MKKIIFDLDNTLLFLSDKWLENIQNFIDEYKLNIEPFALFKVLVHFEEISTDIIITKEYLKNYLSNTLSTNISFDMLNKLFDFYNNIPLLYTDKIYNLLEKLSDKYELITYTNWFTLDQTYRLNKYNLDKFFSHIYGWDILPAKPSVNGLKTIIGNNKLEDFIFVGDNIKSDLELPYEIGMNTVFLNLRGIEQSKYKEIKKIEDLENIL